MPEIHDLPIVLPPRPGNTIPSIPGIDRPEIARRRAVDGVLQGGGALGAAFVGALRGLHDNGIWFSRVAGTSAGAITASMIAAGYTAPEIEFLTASYPGAPAPSSLQQIGLEEPIDFMSFLDLPTPASVRPIRKQTMLWNLLNLSLVDALGTEMDRKFGNILPDRDALVSLCVDGVLDTAGLGAAIAMVPGAKSMLSQSLADALVVLPVGGLQPSDLLLSATFRAQIADALWDAFATREPLLPIATNLIHRGGVFRGEEFLKTMEDLLLRKSPGPQGKTPTFRDLKMPLAILTCDSGSGGLTVYSPTSRSSTSVAEAVRRSMSIPFVFEPRRGFMDGGLLSNYPAWLFGPSGNDYWKPETSDPQRAVVGILLDEGSEPDFDRPTAPGKFKVDPQGQIDLLDVLGPVLTPKMVEAGYTTTEAKAALALLDGMGGGPHVPVLAEAEAMGRILLGAETELRSIVTPALLQGRPYVEVKIPLRGFHFLDFLVNRSKSHLRAMWDRGWEATIRSVTASVPAGPLAAPRVTASPFTPAP